jgi:hypothetical protein
MAESKSRSERKYKIDLEQRIEKWDQDGALDGLLRKRKTCGTIQTRLNTRVGAVRRTTDRADCEEPEAIIKSVQPKEPQTDLMVSRSNKIKAKRTPNRLDGVQI